MNSARRVPAPHLTGRRGPSAQRVGAEVTSTTLPVRGRLPESLDGIFARVGPDSGASQPFTGDPLIAAIRLRAGRAEWFKTKWVRTDRVSRALGELPAPGPRWGLSDDTNANLIVHAGRILALGNGSVLPYELRADLSTKARYDFDGTLPGGFPAHPECDPVTGELYGVASYHEAPYARHVIVDAAGRVRRAEPISVKAPSLMHAYSLTEHYAILFDLPVTFSQAAVAAGRRIPYTWDDSYGARLGILPREGADCDVRWIEVERCYVFHPMNAFERADGRIVVDVVRHERAFGRFPERAGETAPTLWRWTVDLDGELVTEQQLDDRVQEFPTADGRYKGHPYRYGVTTMTGPECQPYGGRSLLRHDLVAGLSEMHDFGSGRVAGDPVFLPRSPQAPEGDGWVLTFVRSSRDDAAEFVILDTADFTGEPVASVTLPAAGPRGFHSAWLPVY